MQYNFTYFPYSCQEVHEKITLKWFNRQWLKGANSIKLDYHTQE